MKPTYVQKQLIRKFWDLREGWFYWRDRSPVNAKKYCQWINETVDALLSTGWKGRIPKNA